METRVGSDRLFSVSHGTKAVGKPLELSGGKCETGKDFFTLCLVNPRNLLLLDALGAENN